VQVEQLDGQATQAPFFTTQLSLHYVQVLASVQVLQFVEQVMQTPATIIADESVHLVHVVPFKH
jgi:hypothetical protein